MLSVRTALSGFFVIAVVWPAAAQEKNEKIQALNVDLGFVNASGNTSVTTINLGDKFVVNSPDKRVIFSQTFNAVRSQTDGTKNAENYRGQLRLDYGLGGKFYLFGITGWDRNVFAGVARRFEETVGLPYQALALPNDDLTLLGVYDNLPGLLPAPAPTGARFKKTDRFLTAGLVAQATGLVGSTEYCMGPRRHDGALGPA